MVNYRLFVVGDASDGPKGLVNTVGACLVGNLTRMRTSRASSDCRRAMTRGILGLLQTGPH
jgi:fluoride ion exporter CrcB/FEX